MERQRTELISIKLEDGSTVKVEATSLSNSQDVASFEDVFHIDKFQKVIAGMANMVSDAFAKINPDKATVEFGVEVGVESGELTALLVKGTGTSNLKITMEWNRK